MSKSQDFKFLDNCGRPARHQVEIFETENWTTVMCTDRSEKYGGASVTNTIENLVNALVIRENLNADRLVVIEHYDDLGPESFDLVKFDKWRDGSLHTPSWRHITSDQATQWCGGQAA